MKKYLILFLITCSTYSFSQDFSQPVEYHSIPFYSTSTMRSVGSTYSSNPLINECDGTATYSGNTYLPNKVSPRRNNSPGTPGPGEAQQPIGDIPWLLMMVLIGFYIIRKKWKKNEIFHFL